jgi:hypothetical protein
MRESELKALKCQDERDVAVKEREHAKMHFKRLQDELKLREEEVATK